MRWRFDLSYPEFRLIIEYDGRQHRHSYDQWSIDMSVPKPSDEWRRYFPSVPDDLTEPA